jgi:hypothetical protein
MTRVWNYFESSRNSDVGYGLLRDLTVNRLQSQHTAALTRADRLPALIRKDPRLVGTRIFGVTNYDTPEYREALKRVGYDEVFAPGEWLAEVMTQVRAINSRQLAA